jgi:hypothetical protein
MKATRRQVSIAMGASLILMLASYAIIQAAPAAQTATPAVTVNPLMAFIVGALYYAAMSPFFANLGFTVLFRPLVAGTLVGIVMGRPAEGIAIGANINVLYLGWISTGTAGRHHLVAANVAVLHHPPLGRQVRRGWGCIGGGAK